jgi:heme oxygenase (biliverdin-IX-beta and delta-forming)
MSAHAQIKAATAAAHASLDRLFSAFKLSTREGYRAFLMAHQVASSPLETALDRFPFEHCLPDWRARRRSEALLADLRALDAPPSAVSPPLIALPSVAAAWGVAYVLEGSRLGGLVMARDLPPEWPRCYLATRPAPGAWPAFLGALNAQLQSDAQRSEATDFAQQAFERFGVAGRAGLDQVCA